MKFNDQSGNVLFYILIAVALFGALGFAVSGMLRSGNDTSLSSEQAKLAASEIIDYGRKLKQAVKYHQISFGCGDEDISFENNASSAYDHDPAADDDCKIFEGNNATVNYQSPDFKWLDPAMASKQFYGQLHFPEGNCIWGIARTEETGNAYSFCDNSTDNVDMIFAVMWVKESICKAINKQLYGSENIYLDINHSISLYPWDGEIDRLGYEIADNNGKLTNVSAMCIQAGNSASHFPDVLSYHYYQVLKAR